MSLIFYQWQCFINIIPNLLFYLGEKIQVKKRIYYSHMNIAKLPFSVYYWEYPDALLKDTDPILWKWKLVRWNMSYLYNIKKISAIEYFTLLFKVLEKLRGLFPLGLH